LNDFGLSSYETVLTKGEKPMTTEFNILKDFIGFGNPEGKYWFIGLEEAGEWGKDLDEDRKNLGRYKNRIIAFKPGDMERDAEDYKRKNPGRKFTRVYGIMSQLVLVASTGTESGSLEYRNNKLLVESGETFQANLYPLGKKTLGEWNDNCAAISGYKSREDYYRNVPGERFRMLREEWTKYHPPITICFGSTEWDRFKELLDLKSETDYEDCGWYQVYLSRIILCPFFVDYLMSKKRLLLLAREIRRLLDKASTQQGAGMSLTYSR
jgi:hypothetical protein